jgi:hypothetical protein
MESVYVVEILALRKELDVLKAENRLLKDTLSTAWDEDVHCGKSRSRTISNTERARWKFYHEIKNATAANVAKDLGIPTDVVSWRLVKKKTDEAFVEKTQ